MKLKPHRPRSCLGWFAWVFGTLLVLFVLGNVYAQLRMAQVTWELVALARELGYTSDTHLHHEMKMRDTNIAVSYTHLDVYKRQVRIVLFAFAPGQELTEHTSTREALIHVLDGRGEITLGSETVEAGAGTLIRMAPKLPHSVHAHSPLRMLLYMLGK